VFRGQNAIKLAQEFCKKHDLTTEKQARLKEYIEMKISKVEKSISFIK
jgi:hypothetical protein